MTNEEFNAWRRNYCTLFPETAEWMNRLDAELRTNMLRHWAKCLRTVTYRDAFVVNWKMFEGDDPAFPPLGQMFGDREKIPSHVRRLCKSARFARRQRVARRSEQRRRQQQRRESDATRYKYGMPELLRAYLEMLHQGDPEAKAKMRAMADELAEPGDRGSAAGDGASALAGCIVPDSACPAAEQTADLFGELADLGWDDGND